MTSDERPTLDQTLMLTAEVWGRRSTCPKAQVGCVISVESRILVQGYNGAPSGMPHCDHTCDCPAQPGDPHATACRSTRKCETAQHAERNAVAYAARRGVALLGAEVHVTREPCLGCSWVLVGAGVERVVYGVSRNTSHDGLEFLEAVGTKVEQWA